MTTDNSKRACSTDVAARLASTTANTGGGGSGGRAFNGGHEIDYENTTYSLPKGWERRTQDDVPYFINHVEENTQWDHPSFSALMDSLLELNDIKYAAYRMASKLRRVQKRLGLELLDLESANIGFELHGLSQDRHEFTIQVPEMVVVLTSVFETIKNEEIVGINVALQVDLTLNYLLNLFDVQRCGSIRVESFKLGILLLCGGPLTEKYIHLFNLAANVEGKMKPPQLGRLVYDCIQIPRIFGEVAYFGGTNVEPSIRGCFERLPADCADKQVDCTDFVRWLKQEPQCMVWLPVLHRLSSAEIAKHSVKCKVCKVQPIIGFRYHCQKCFNFDMCHNCFFVGKTAKGHKTTHPMKEYCTSTGASVKIKNFGQSVRNSFRRKKYFDKKQQKLSYRPIQSVAEGDLNHLPPSAAAASNTTPVPSIKIEQVMTDNGSFMDRSFDSRIPSTSEVSFQRGVSVASATPAGNNDEHSLIAAYCQALNDKLKSAAAAASMSMTSSAPAAVMTSSDSAALAADTTAALQKMEHEINLEEVLHELSERNARLRQEYDALASSAKLPDQDTDNEDDQKPKPAAAVAAPFSPSPVNGDGGKRAQEEEEEEEEVGADSSDGGVSLNEATSKLRQHTARMEARISILLEHNKQLEARLSRLRRLLHQLDGPDNESYNSRFGTLRTRAVVAANLTQLAVGGGAAAAANTAPPVASSASGAATAAAAAVVATTTTTAEINQEEDCDSDSSGSSMSYCADDQKLGSKNSSLNLSANEEAEKSDDF